MTTDTLTLSAFLMQRIADDEAAARAVPAGGGSWEAGDRCVWRVSDVASVEIVTDGYDGEGGCETPEIAAHIARHDPARVLAQCEALRHVIELRYSWNLQAERNPEPPFGPILQAQVVTADATLRALARIYADRPGWQEAWA